jgi:hypothetical protein
MTFQDDYPEIGDELPQEYHGMIYAACLSRSKVVEVLNKYVAEINKQQIIQELRL